MLASCRVAAETEVLGDEVFRSSREDRQRNAGLFVEQGRHRAVTADGDQAAAMGVALDLHTRLARFFGCPGDLLRSPAAFQSLSKTLDCTSVPCPIPELRLATMPTQSFAPERAGALVPAPVERNQQFGCAHLRRIEVSSSSRAHRRLSGRSYRAISRFE